MWPITALGGAGTVLGAWAGLLVHADLTWRRLPDRLTLPAAAGALVGALLVDPFLLMPGLVWPALYLLVGIIAGGVGEGTSSSRCPWACWWRPPAARPLCSPRFLLPPQVGRWRGWFRGAKKVRMDQR